MEQRNSHVAPIGYRATVIAECARGRLRDHGAQLSATAKLTALNAADSGHGGVSAHRGEIKAREGDYLGSPGHFPSPPLPSSPPLHPERTAKSERRKRKERERESAP